MNFLLAPHNYFWNLSSKVPCFGSAANLIVKEEDTTLAKVIKVALPTLLAALPVLIVNQFFSPLTFPVGIAITVLSSITWGHLICRFFPAHAADEGSKTGGGAGSSSQVQEGASSVVSKDEAVANSTTDALKGAKAIKSEEQKAGGGAGSSSQVQEGASSVVSKDEAVANSTTDALKGPKAIKSEEQKAGGGAGGTANKRRKKK